MTCFLDLSSPKFHSAPITAFTGQNQDTAAGLYDFLYREYAPTQGRWISPDPAGLSAADPSNPQSWNRYAYVANDPLNMIDPSGLLECIDDGCSMDGGGGYSSDGYCPPDRESCGGFGGGFGIGVVFGGGSSRGGTGGTGTRGDIANFPNGESLGIPAGMSLHPGSLGSVFIPSIDPSCDFGVCATVDDPFTDPNPTAGGLGGASYTFHTYVFWPYLLDPATMWEIDSRGLTHSDFTGLLGAIGLRHYYFYNIGTGEAVGLGPDGWETQESHGRTELVFSEEQSRCIDLKLRHRGAAPQYFFLQGRENVYPRPTALNCFGYCMRVAHSCE